jgi:hypothetical protein
MTATIGDGVVLTVEIGFATTSGNGLVPLGGNLTDIVWTDVSTSVRSVSTKRGRSSELDSFTAGSANVTFSNAARTFDPEYSAGPYFGKLTPGRPIRISAQYAAGATTSLFFGFVESWDQQYAPPADAICVVTASDAFKVLNQLTLPHYWEHYIGTESPTAWFRFDDGDIPETALDSVSQIPTGVWYEQNGTPATGAGGDSLLANDSSVCATFDGTTYLGLPSESFKYDDDNYLNLSLECWISTTTETDGNYAIFHKYGFDSIIAIGMVVSGGVGTIQVQVGYLGSPGLTIVYGSTRRVNDGNRHHIAICSDWDLGLNVYVDAFSATLDDSYGIIFDTYGFIPDARVGYPFSPSSDSTFNFPLPFVGSVDELIYYSNQTLSANDVLIRRNIGKGTLGAGDLASARATSVLNIAQWMTDARAITASGSTVQGYNTQGKTVLAALQECEAAEQGRLFIAADGDVRFIARQELSTSSSYNVPSRTYGDDSGELPYLDIAFVYNDDLIRNVVSVSRANGATVTLEDTTSQGQYFVRSDSLSDLITNDDTFSSDVANARLQFYKQPSSRVESLSVNPRSNPASLYPAVIGDEIGTRITVKRRPQGVGSAISKELMIEGISHTISPDTWTTTYNCSPAPTVYFLLDSASFGVLNTNLLGY